MSDSHFRHCFKEVTGLSFVQYLNEFRITRAQLLLGSTGQPVSQVAQEVGFGNQSHFGRLFKKLVNLSPTEYRTQIRVSGRKSRQIASGRP
jgi:AraC-like DNA-binding protein